MTLRSSSVLALVSAALLASCGRSQLRDSSAASAGSGGSGGDGGSGPAPSSASASSGGGMGPGGAGGAGGSTALCVLDGQPIGPAGTEVYNLTNPVLIAPEKAGVATLVAGWTAALAPITQTELRHTSFDAWGPWPADGTIGPSYLADYDGGKLFAAAPAIGGFSLFFAGTDPSPHLTFLSPLTPGSGNIPGSFQLGAALAEPLFVAQGTKSDNHLMGFAGSAMAPHDFNLLHLTAPLNNPVVTAGLGCAQDPIVAAGLPALDGFLVAFSSGTDFTNPACQGGGSTNAATRLLIARVADAGPITPVVMIENDPAWGSIAAINVVPSGDGAWVAWTHQLGNGLPLRVVHIDFATSGVEGPMEVPFSGEPASLSAARIGDRLALAWTEAEIELAPLVHVSVLGGSGVVADVAIALSPSATATGRTALLGSPSGDALLVSWVEIASFKRKLRTARISCSLP